MGNNIDFPYLMNVPILKCPKCKASFENQLEEWDIDCGTEMGDGVYEFDITCEDCGTESTVKIELNTKTYLNGKEVVNKVNKCGECGDEMTTDEEIEFGECNACSAWKYRENCK
jgi:DNA-directed RNA polymerase subunit RPC12/RpoP